MRFVIATLPDVDFNLGRDLALLKTCAVYGDETVLFSPNYAFTANLLDFSSRPLEHQLLYLAVIHGDPGFVEGEKLTGQARAERIKRATARKADLLAKAEVVRDVVSGVDRSPQAHANLKAITRDVAPLVASIERTWSDERDSVRRARELAKAEKMGLVKIQSIHPAPNLYFSQGKLEADVATELSRGDSYGALDERLLPAFAGIPRAAAQKMGMAIVAASALQALPGFTTAGFDELRDIRAALSPHLAAFRKALTEIAVSIEAQPWDPNFPHDVDRELHMRLHPAVAEIATEVQENSYLKEIIHRAAARPLVVPATSALGLLLSSAAQVPALVAQISSALAGAGLLALEAHKEWKANLTKTGKNEFFFYYRASAMLETRRRHQRGQ